MNKKLYILVLTLGLGLVGCGTNPYKSEVTNQTVTTATPPPEVEKPKTPAELIANMKVIIETLKSDGWNGGYQFALKSDVDLIPKNTPEYKEALQLMKNVDKIASDQLKAKKKQEAQEKAILKSQGVTLGMTWQRVIQSSWGKPDSINTTHFRGIDGREIIHEQWVYRKGYKFHCLYFEDGILTSIQD